LFATAEYTAPVILVEDSPAAMVPVVVPERVPGLAALSATPEAWLTVSGAPVVFARRR
jgi:hypothetical protein